ncbi:hypothetical protein [Proteus mirabilis]
MVRFSRKTKQQYVSSEKEGKNRKRKNDMVNTQKIHKKNRLKQSFFNQY